MKKVMISSCSLFFSVNKMRPNSNKQLLCVFLLLLLRTHFLIKLKAWRAQERLFYLFTRSKQYTGILSTYHR